LAVYTEPSPLMNLHTSRPDSPDITAISDWCAVVYKQAPDSQCWSAGYRCRHQVEAHSWCLQRDNDIFCADWRWLTDRTYRTLLRSWRVSYSIVNYWPNSLIEISQLLTPKENRTPLSLFSTIFWFTVGGYLNFTTCSTLKLTSLGFGFICCCSSQNSS